MTSTSLQWSRQIASPPQDKRRPRGGARKSRVLLLHRTAAASGGCICDSACCQVGSGRHVRYEPRPFQGKIAPCLSCERSDANKQPSIGLSWIDLLARDSWIPPKRPCTSDPCYISTNGLDSVRFYSRPQPRHHPRWHLMRCSPPSCGGNALCPRPHPADCHLGGDMGGHPGRRFRHGLHHQRQERSRQPPSLRHGTPQRLPVTVSGSNRCRHVPRRPSVFGARMRTTYIRTHIGSLGTLSSDSVITTGYVRGEMTHPGSRRTPAPLAPRSEFA